MIQSACAMTAWWCSMTMTDLPESTSRSSRPSRPNRFPSHSSQVVATPAIIARQPADRALEDHLATGTASAGAEGDDVVGDRDRVRLVLHHEHRVALVAQLQQQVVHLLNVMGVQADGRLVEDVRDVGERGTEVADHLDTLRLAARERARRAVEAEVAEPDGDRRVEGLLQPVDAWHTGFAVMVDTAVRGPV